MAGGIVMTGIYGGAHDGDAVHCFPLEEFYFVAGVDFSAGIMGEAGEDFNIVAEPCELFGEL